MFAEFLKNPLEVHLILYKSTRSWKELSLFFNCGFSAISVATQLERFIVVLDRSTWILYLERLSASWKLKSKVTPKVATWWENFWKYMLACTWTSEPKWSSHIDGYVHGQVSTFRKFENANNTQGCFSVGASFEVHGRMYLDIWAEVVEFFRCSTSNLVLALTLRKVVKDYNWQGKHLLMFSSCIVKYRESRAQNLIFWKGFPNLSKIGVLQLSVFSTFWKFENASNPQDAFQLEHLLKYMDACT